MWLNLASDSLVTYIANRDDFEAPGPPAFIFRAGIRHEPLHWVYAVFGAEPRFLCM